MWFAVWDGAGVTYTEFQQMHIQEFQEAIASREMYVAELNKRQQPTRHRKGR